MHFLEYVTPTRLYVLFSTDDAFYGSMSLIGKSDASLTFTFILQAAGETRSYDMAGDDRVGAVPFQDAEAFMVLARRSGAIVASGVFEIDCALSGVGLLLIPRALNNLLIHQELQAPRTAPLVTETAVQVL